MPGPDKDFRPPFPQIKAAPWKRLVIDDDDDTQRPLLHVSARDKVAKMIAAEAAAPPPRSRLIEGDSAYRKDFPMCTGLMDYFPDALAAVANVSKIGNDKHNPGEPMHHARGKSMDHADCIMRHLQERGGFEIVVINGVEHRIRHSVALAWRALALAQEELEREMKLSLPRAAR